MLKALAIKVHESIISVMPITLIVLIAALTPLVNLTNEEMSVFASSAVFLVFGIALFNLGADMAMTPMGEHVGEGLTKSRKIGVLLAVSFVMGDVYYCMLSFDTNMNADEMMDMAEEIINSR